MLYIMQYVERHSYKRFCPSKYATHIDTDNCYNIAVVDAMKTTKKKKKKKKIMMVMKCLGCCRKY